PAEGGPGGEAKAAPVAGDGQINHGNAPSRRADLPTQPQCAQVNRTSASSLASGRPQMHTQPRRRAGFPTTRAWAGTSLVTTAPMPTMAYAPMQSPGPMRAPAPSVAPSSTRPGSVSAVGAELARPATPPTTARGGRVFAKMPPAETMTRSAMVMPVGM